MRNPGFSSFGISSKLSLFPCAGWTRNYERHRESGGSAAGGGARKDSAFVCEARRRGPLRSGGGRGLRAATVTADACGHGHASRAPKRNN